MTANAEHLAKSVENPFRLMRVKLQLSRESLAERTSVPLETVIAAEEDPISLPLHELSSLANYLNLDPGDLFEYLHARLGKRLNKGRVQ